MPYLLTSTTPDKLKQILVQAGLEILAEGADDLVAFLTNEKHETPNPLTLIWLSESFRELAELRDRPVFMVEGVSTSLQADPRLLETLKAIVADGVKRYGFFVVDLEEFGISVETATAVAAGAGLEVSAGQKAVFAPVRNVRTK